MLVIIAHVERGAWGGGYLVLLPLVGREFCIIVWCILSEEFSSLPSLPPSHLPSSLSLSLPPSLPLSPSIHQAGDRGEVARTEVCPERVVQQRDGAEGEGERARCSRETAALKEEGVSNICFVHIN